MNAYMCMHECLHICICVCICDYMCMGYLCLCWDRSGGVGVNACIDKLRMIIIVYPTNISADMKGNCTVSYHG